MSVSGTHGCPRSNHPAPPSRSEKHLTPRRPVPPSIRRSRLALDRNSLARLPTRPLRPPAQQSSTHRGSKRVSVCLAGCGFEASRARSPSVRSTLWNERRMVGIAGGLSRETPSPANASEPRLPAAEAAGRRGSFHAPATLRLDEAGGAACSTPYCSLARATPAHPQSHASAPRPPACSLHPLPPLLRISWSRTSPASVAALAVRRTAGTERREHPLLLGTPGARGGRSRRPGALWVGLGPARAPARPHLRSKSAGAAVPLEALARRATPKQLSVEKWDLWTFRNVEGHL